MVSQIPEFPRGQIVPRFKLFSLFGFEVGIDASWFLLAVLIAWTLARSVFPVIASGLARAG